MINSYEIKIKNNEEILCIYFDFSLEFAKLKGKAKKKKINNIVKEFIKENNINFHGKKIAIIAGGLLIGTLVLNKPVQTYETNFTTNKIVSIFSPIKIDEVASQESSIITSESIIYDNIEKNEEKKNLNKENDIINNSEKEDSDSSLVTNNPKQEQLLKKEENNNEEIQIKENKTYVTIYRNDASITLELEEYITGVVGAEMPASFDKEALKAQAILSRTYALKAIQNNIRLTDSSITQNYKNNDELRNMWGSSYNDYCKKILSAVNETKGKYLAYNGALIEAVYHSTSNGTTENAQNVWGNSFPYLVSVESKYDIINPSFLKEQFLSYDELSIKLNMNININSTFEIISKT